MDSYLIGQIALLRLEQRRYDEARIEFERYFASIERIETRSNPEHAPIYEGYSRLLRETANQP